MKSLASIAESLGLSQQGLKNKIDKYEADTGADFYGQVIKTNVDARLKRYPQAAIDGLLRWLDPDHELEPEPVAPLVTVVEGNHRTGLDTPVIEGEISLAQFRDESSLSFDDPLAVAEQFMLTADIVIAALTTDIRDQRSHLRETERAQKLIEQKAQELLVQRAIYRDRADTLAAQQTDKTQDLQAALASLQALGKPQSAG